MTDNPYEYLRDEHEHIVSAGPTNDEVDADCFVQSEQKLTDDDMRSWGFEVVSATEGSPVWRHTLREIEDEPDPGPPFADIDEAVEYFESLDPSPLVFPQEGPGMSNFECPECGNRIQAPYGGHVWTCHESYGGCGASFRPVKAFVRVEQ